MCVVRLLQVDAALAAADTLGIAADSSHGAEAGGGLDAGSLTGGLGHAAAGEVPQQNSRSPAFRVDDSGQGVLCSRQAVHRGAACQASRRCCGHGKSTLFV